MGMDINLFEINPSSDEFIEFFEGKDGFEQVQKFNPIITTEEVIDEDALIQKYGKITLMVSAGDYFVKMEFASGHTIVDPDELLYKFVKCAKIHITNITYHCINYGEESHFKNLIYDTPFVSTKPSDLDILIKNLKFKDDIKAVKNIASMLTENRLVVIYY